MKDDDEYELTPHKEIAKLRSEISRLRNEHSSEDVAPEDLSAQIKDLNHSIKSLTLLFKDAATELIHTDTQTAQVHSQFSPMASKIDVLIEQNRKIAAGIVSVAELIKEKMNEPAKPEPKPFPEFNPLSNPPEQSLATSPEVAIPPFETQLGSGSVHPSGFAPPGLKPMGQVTPPPMSFTQSGGMPMPPPMPPEPDKKKGLFGKFK